MSRKMIHIIALNLTLFVASALTALCVAPVGSEACDLTIQIDVAPNVLNINNQGEVVTVHTNIAYGAVVGSTVYLNGVSIKSWKYDNRGNFVAKFNMAAIKDLPLDIGEYNTLELRGETTSGETFCGAQEILVVDKGPKK